CGRKEWIVRRNRAVGVDAENLPFEVGQDSGENAIAIVSDSPRGDFRLNEARWECGCLAPGRGSHIPTGLRSVGNRRGGCRKQSRWRFHPNPDRLQREDSPHQRRRHDSSGQSILCVRSRSVSRHLGARVQKSFYLCHRSGDRKDVRQRCRRGYLRGDQRHGCGWNYGWPNLEGPGPGFRNPFYYYGRDQGCALTAETFYSPALRRFPAKLTGKYFFADWCDGWIKTIDPANPASVAPFGSGAGRVMDLEVGRDGNLYYIEWPGDSVFKLEYTGIDLTANGSDGPLVVHHGQPLEISLAFQARDPGFIWRGEWRVRRHCPDDRQPVRL